MVNYKNPIPLYVGKIILGFSKIKLSDYPFDKTISRIICNYTQFKRSNTFIYLKSFKIHYVHYLVPRAEDDEKFGFSQHQN